MIQHFRSSFTTQNENALLLKVRSCPNCASPTLITYNIGIEALFEGPFYQWYLWDHLQKIPPAQTATNAIDNVLDIIAEEGPFDGIVGFSQGAAITASV